VTNSLEEIDAVLSRTQSVDESIPTSTLRQWRSELVRASVFASYGVGVLSLDLEVLKHCSTATSEDVLQSLVDDLPSILASGWVGGGWSLSPDASASVAAAAESGLSQSEGLFRLHGELVMSDLSDPAVVSDLLVRIAERREVLTQRRDELERRIKAIQEVVKRHYATGVASVDDWLA
jgi:hypothetical protein